LLPVAALPRTSAGTRSGVTLPELMVALAIITVLLALGTPNLRSLFGDSARATAANTLIGTLRFARTEAVNRAVDVLVCPGDGAASAGTAADPCIARTAASGNIAWQQGYLVAVAETGEPLRVQPAARGVTIETPASVERLRFRPDGSLSGRSGSFRVCAAGDDAASDEARDSATARPSAVVISRVGRVRSAERLPGGAPIDCS
jgi:type IV fimbrial biogenesis protein FimT